MRRHGFTVLELIVVLAVIGLLVSLLAPAVQSAREAARQTSCRSHLKQLGIALHSYHDLHGALPQGSIMTGPGGPPAGNGGWWGWGVMLLPHLDQGPLYAKLNPQGEQCIFSQYYWREGTILPGGDTVLPVFRCPSSILPDHATSLGPGQLSEVVQGYSTADYKGCSGGESSGLFPENTDVIRWRDVTDGLSQTIAVGEASYPGRAGRTWPLWIGSYHNDENNFSTMPPMNGVPSFAGRFWMNAPSDQCALSMHPGLVNFLFADGAVHALSQNIDRRVYSRLGNRRDGRVISLDF